MNIHFDSNVNMNVNYWAIVHSSASVAITEKWIVMQKAFVETRRKIYEVVPRCAETEGKTNIGREENHKKWEISFHNFSVEDEAQ